MCSYLIMERFEPKVVAHALTLHGEDSSLYRHSNVMCTSQPYLIRLTCVRQIMYVVRYIA